MDLEFVFHSKTFSIKNTVRDGGEMVGGAAILSGPMGTIYENPALPTLLEKHLT